MPVAEVHAILNRESAQVVWRQITFVTITPDGGHLYNFVFIRFAPLDCLLPNREQRSRRIVLDHAHLTASAVRFSKRAIQADMSSSTD